MIYKTLKDNHKIKKTNYFDISIIKNFKYLRFFFFNKLIMATLYFTRKN